VSEPFNAFEERWGSPAQNAPPGTTWVCGACGKRASNRYDGGIDYGWDVSCTMNAVLCRTDSIRLDDHDRVAYADPVAIKDRHD
jgi:hypothetical protein